MHLLSGEKKSVSMNDRTTSVSSLSSTSTFSVPVRALSDEALLRTATCRRMAFGNGPGLLGLDHMSWLKHLPERIASVTFINRSSIDETDGISKKSDPTDSIQRERETDSQKDRQSDSDNSGNRQKRRDEAVKLCAANVSRIVHGGMCKWAWKRKLKPIHYRSGGGDSVWFV
jgi:hypothetical protein